MTLLAAVVAIAVSGLPGIFTPPRPTYEAVEWRPSPSRGVWWDGRLDGGVRFLHVRLAEEAPGLLLGRSHDGRAIRAYRIGDASSPRKVLVVGCVHGNECAGKAVTGLVLRSRRRIAADIWVVPDLNPDGSARRQRHNARGVDLNRNFPAGWRPLAHAGPRPLSERESRIARNLVVRLRPRLTVWFHQPQAVVRAWGPSVGAARRYARLAGMPYRSLPWPPGAATRWQNRTFPAGAGFVVELPPGLLPPAAARRHADALLRLANE